MFSLPSPSLRYLLPWIWPFYTHFVFEYLVSLCSPLHTFIEGSYFLSHTSFHHTNTESLFSYSTGIIFICPYFSFNLFAKTRFVFLIFRWCLSTILPCTSFASTSQSFYQWLALCIFFLVSRPFCSIFLVFFCMSFYSLLLVLLAFPSITHSPSFLFHTSYTSFSRCLDLSGI